MSKSNRPTNEEARKALLVKAIERLISAAGLVEKALADTNREQFLTSTIKRQITVARETIAEIAYDADDQVLDDGGVEYDNDWWVRFAFEVVDESDLMDDDKVSEVQGQFYDEAEDEVEGEDSDTHE